MAQSLQATGRAQSGAVGPSVRFSGPAFVPIRAGIRLQQRRQQPGGAAPLQQRQRRQQRQRAAARALAVRVNALRNIDWPQALLFDCDGVRCGVPMVASQTWAARRCKRHPQGAERVRSASLRIASHLHMLDRQVLVDTEAEGHRVAFNEAFKRKGGSPAAGSCAVLRAPPSRQQALATCTVIW